MSFSAEVEEYIRESLGHLLDLELSTDEIAQLEQLVHKQKREVQQVDIQKKMLDQIVSCLFKYLYNIPGRRPGIL